MLEHHAAVMPTAFDHDAVHGDLPAARIFEPHRDAQRGGLAAAARADQRDDLAVADLEVQVIERRHGLRHAVDAQRKPLRHVDEIHRAHYFTSSSALARISGATTFVRSAGFGMLPFFSSMSWVQASLSIGRPISGSMSRCFVASSKMKAGRGSSGFALVVSMVSLISSSRLATA